MDFLRNLFKKDGVNTKQNIMLLAAIGVILLIMSQSLFKNSKTIEDNAKTKNTQDILSNEELIKYNYEEKTEKKLEEIFANVEGVGKVKVLVTVSYSSEIVLAEDFTSSESSTTESDSQGGTRENTNKTMDSKKIILQSPSGGQEPLILKEIVPKVEGVIIVSEGGENVIVKEKLINAAVAVLGVESHKVQVLKMKSMK